MTQALIFVNCDANCQEAIRDHVGQVEGVQEVHMTTGIYDDTQGRVGERSNAQGGRRQEDKVDRRRQVDYHHDRFRPSVLQAANDTQ